ncbi:hypothetical protein TM102_10560 [Bradyrhizobium sp. TM102]|nr:hypothetical protein TM102_10560 [Bradyrhizobium sp. TM102]
MREVDEIHDAEHQRQAGGEQEQQQAELQPVQELFDDKQHQDSFRRTRCRADVRTRSPSVKELPLPVQGGKMGNGSIVPRQERFDTKHALCCMPMHAVETLLQESCRAGWGNLPHPNDDPLAGGPARGCDFVRM